MQRITDKTYYYCYIHLNRNAGKHRNAATNPSNILISFVVRCLAAARSMLNRREELLFT